tara:strand:- start:24 stop:674 length:651 start_codon:yes stop_codon:yes gene_type:complete
LRKPKDIIAKPKISTILILILGGTLGIVLGTILTLKGFEKQVLLILGIAFIGLGIYSIYWIINFDILKITDGKLIFKSITGITKKTIPLTEFQSYTEIEKQNAQYKSEFGYMKWKDLTLIGDNFTYKLSSTSYTNYEELRRELIKGLKRNTKAEDKWNNNNLTYIGVGVILFGLFIGLWFWNASEIANEKNLSIIISFGFIGYGIFLLNRRKKASR